MLEQPEKIELRKQTEVGMATNHGTLVFTRSEMQGIATKIKKHGNGEADTEQGRRFA